MEKEKKIKSEEQKKEIIPCPICSVIAVLKMLIRIINTLRSRIWDRGLFLFSVFWLQKGRLSENSDNLI